MVQATYLFLNSINFGTAFGQDMTGMPCLTSTVTETADCVSETAGDTLKNGLTFQLTDSRILIEVSSSELRNLSNIIWVVLMRFSVTITDGKDSLIMGTNSYQTMTTKKTPVIIHTHLQRFENIDLEECQKRCD